MSVMVICWLLKVASNPLQLPTKCSLHLPTKTFCIFVEKVLAKNSSQYRESEWYQQICGGESTLADAIMDRISYDSYKIDIESMDPSKDISMREVYGLDPAKVK